MTEYTKESTIERLSKINPVWAKIFSKYEWNSKLKYELMGVYDDKGKEFPTDEARRDFTGHMHTITATWCCMVGEAHNYSNSYFRKCDTCRRHAFSMQSGEVDTFEGNIPVKTKKLLTESDWITYINEYIDHFESEHQLELAS